MTYHIQYDLTNPKHLKVRLSIMAKKLKAGLYKCSAYSMYANNGAGGYIYVADTPRGTGDFEWTEDMHKAVPINAYYAQRFLADGEFLGQACGRTSVYRRHATKVRLRPYLADAREGGS